MRANLELAAATFLAPAAAAWVASWLCGRLLPASAAARYCLAVGLAGGFFAGYVLLPQWAPLAPDRHWHWIPYVTLAAAVVGPLGCASGVGWWERALLAGGLFIVAAWLTVPTWETLAPPRIALVPSLALYLLLLAMLLSLLPDRLLGAGLVGLLAASALGTAGAIAIATSFKYGQVMALAAGAIVGCWLCLLVTRKPGEETALAVRALAPVYSLLVGSMAFVGGIELEPPEPVLLVAPAAPLALWIFAAGPLARISRWWAIALQSVAVLMPLTAAIAWVAVAR